MSYLAQVAGMELTCQSARHWIPLRPIATRDLRCLKKTLRKPQLKQWWYLKQGRVDTWVECKIVEVKEQPHGLVPITIVAYYDEDWGEDFTAQVFDPRRLAFAVNRPH